AFAGLPERPPGDASGSVAELRLAMDRVPAEAASLHAFQRRPWPLDLATVPVWRQLAARLELPPAAVLPATSPAAFGTRGCRPAAP
ncbi:MAG TPA: hypothetical protein VHQ65_02470, partial [Thermoanaerobaculia bacterium]|nr:hypothetical protein [Thermoanaerobaculia bacterium]